MRGQSGRRCAVAYITKEDLIARVQYKRETLEKAEALIIRAMKGEHVDLRPGCSVRDLDKDVLKLRRELEALEKRLETRLARQG